VKYVALCRLGISEPGATFETRGYSEEGEPIVRKRTREVLPGEIIELSGLELQELLAAGAVRPATEAELLMGHVDSTGEIARRVFTPAGFWPVTEPANDQ
jgi:hypothetical protein